MSKPTSRNSSGIQVIARAADILRALEGRSEGMSLGELSESVALARSTVQRIVNALLDEEFLMPASQRARVKLGPALVRLGSAANVEILQIARPCMLKIAKEISETVDLSTLKRDHAVFIEQIPGSYRLSALSEVGTEFPLHSTANGKSLLACMPSAKRDKLYEAGLSRDTDATLTSPKKIEQEMKRFYETGLCFDIEEHTEGVCAVATAFIDSFGRAYSISIPAPNSRFKKNRDLFESVLLETREELITKLRGTIPMAG